MSEKFDLESYLASSVEDIVKDLLKTAVFHPKESLFMAQYARANRKATAKRLEAAKEGRHIPPFLIASITNRCNLNCAGCYAHALGNPNAGEPLSATEWGRIFEEAKNLGISFILLAGGEPLTRRDVLEEAAKVPEILFPVFTNGTMFSEDYLKLFEQHRNLIPVLSLEGGQHQTDARRGQGVHERVEAVMQQMRAQRLAFGASITVTSTNREEVLSQDFVKQLEEGGCKAIIYVEFVPVQEALKPLALSDEARKRMEEDLQKRREEFDKMLLISFPGDEKSSGGCLAAGRGFFHINPQGGAEPCPFSPYSDMNVRDHTLEEVMTSPLFRALRDENVLTQQHEGGCVLFENRQQVEELLAKEK